MSSTTTLERSSRPLPAAVPPPPLRAPAPAEPPRAEAPQAPALGLPARCAAVYRQLQALGRRWRLFPRKFQPRSRQPHSNWVDRKPRTRLADLRKMY